MKHALNRARVDPQFDHQLLGESYINAPSVVLVGRFIVRGAGDNNGAFHVVCVVLLSLSLFDMVP